MDDNLVINDVLEEIILVKQTLHELFKIKELRETGYFLGMEISIGATGIEVTQRKYALDLLEDTSFLSSKPVASPIETNVKFNHGDSELLSDNTNYKNT